MPQQTVYIREKDMPKWKATKNKAELVSFALQLTDYEIKELEKLRSEREKRIKLAASK